MTKTHLISKSSMSKGMPPQDFSQSVKVIDIRQQIKKMLDVRQQEMKTADLKQQLGKTLAMFHNAQRETPKQSRNTIESMGSIGSPMMINTVSKTKVFLSETPTSQIGNRPSFVFPSTQELNRTQSRSYLQNQSYVKPDRLTFQPPRTIKVLSTEINKLLWIKIPENY